MNIGEQRFVPALGEVCRITADHGGLRPER